MRPITSYLPHPVVLSVKSLRDEGRVMVSVGSVRRKKKNLIRPHKEYSALWLISSMERLDDNSVVQKFSLDLLRPVDSVVF